MLSTALEQDRKVFICRELTKKFEQLVSVSAHEIPLWIEGAESLKGEFIVLIEGRQASTNGGPDHQSMMNWAKALNPYMGSKEIAAVLSEAVGMAKKDAYRIALDVKAINQPK